MKSIRNKLSVFLIMFFSSIAVLLVPNVMIRYDWRIFAVVTTIKMGAKYLKKQMNEIWIMLKTKFRIQKKRRIVETMEV